MLIDLVTVMAQEALYEFLFKRTVQDMDQLMDLAPAGLRGRVRHARAELLKARPETLIRQTLEVKCHGGHQEYIGEGLCPTCYPGQSESPRSGQKTSLEGKDSEKPHKGLPIWDHCTDKECWCFQGAKTPRAEEVSEKLGPGVYDLVMDKPSTKAPTRAPTFDEALAGFLSPAGGNGGFGKTATQAINDSVALLKETAPLHDPVPGGLAGDY